MLGIRRGGEGEAAMSEYELIVRGGEAATASDTFRADVGVRGGKIAAIADKPSDGARPIRLNELNDGAE
jgi:N-acyl-D-aspartate/D-glutamate deacylase